MGFLLIDKPKGVTSHDVIDEIRKITAIKKIGHAGTLDPNATGLLIIAIRRESTKKLGSLTKNTKKTYVADIFLGEERDTLDSEGKVVSTSKTIPDFSEVKNVIKKHKGKQKQIPPIFSAIKMKGKKAYELARKGKKIEMQPREVNIYKLKLVKYKYPDLILEMEVSAGTYIRSVARDIGKNLRTGAYLKNLRRTRIGEFKVEDSFKISELSQDNWNEKMIDI